MYEQEAKESENLRKEIIRLKKCINHYHKRIELDCNRNWKPISLKDWQLEKLQTALVPLNADILRRMNKLDIMVVILNREGFMYKKIDEYQESLKHNDRTVFRNQQIEIARLTNLLVNNEPLFKGNIDLKNKNRKLKQLLKLEKESKLLLCSKIQELEKKINTYFRKFDKKGVKNGIKKMVR